MESGMIVLFGMGQLPVTAYGLSLAAALLAGFALLMVRGRKMGLQTTALLDFVLLAVPLALMGARVFYVACRLGLYSEMGAGEAVRMWHGGYALWGAIAGGVLAAFLCRKKAGGMLRMMDAAAAPAALMIGLGRLAEVFNGEGIGMLVEQEGLCFFPLAIQNEWGEWYYAIFMLEALAAFIILWVLLRQKAPEGKAAKTFFFLFCTCSLLIESLRRDQFLRWLFVRVNQLTAVLVLTGMLAFVLVKWIRHPQKRRFTKGKVAAGWVGFALLAGICIALEFAVDKAAWLPVWACYTLMAGFVAAMGVCAGKLLFKSVE